MITTSSGADSDSQFLSAFEFSAIGMALATAEGRLFKVNNSLCNILGFAKADLVTHTFQDLTHPDDLQTDLHLLEELMTGKRQSYQMEKRYIHSTGRMVWALLMVSAVRDSEGNILHFIKQIQDISGLKTTSNQLKQSENQFQSAFEFSAIGMALATPAGKLFEVNNSLCKMLGYSQLQLLNRSFQEITLEDDLEIDLHLLEELMSGKSQSYQMEKRYIHADGHIVWAILAVSAAREVNGKIIHLIKQIQDISAIKEKELKLEVLNKFVNDCNEELVYKNEALKQFAYIASHDLKEPLRMVTGFLSKIKNRYHDVLDQQGEQYIHYAIDGATRMRKLIEDILAYSTIDSLINTPKEEVDLNILISDIFLVNRVKDDDKTPVLKTEKLPVIKSNHTLLYQLFSNLISNAIKYQQPENSPVIEIKVEDKPGLWQFAISDNGIGIDPAGIEKVFNIFQRLHSKDDYSGTGIGLAICKKIVNMFKGDIWIKSTPGLGSTFYFSFSK